MSGRLALKPAAVLRPVSNEEVHTGAVRALRHGVGTGVAVMLAGVPPSPLQALAAAAHLQAGADASTDASPVGAKPGSSSRKRKAHDSSPAAVAAAAGAAGGAAEPTPASGRARRASACRQVNQNDDFDSDSADDEEASKGRYCIQRGAGCGWEAGCAACATALHVLPLPGLWVVDAHWRLKIPLCRQRRS